MGMKLSFQSTVDLTKPNKFRMNKNNDKLQLNAEISKKRLELGYYF